MTLAVHECLAERLYWDARGSGSSSMCAQAAAAYASHARYALHVCRCRVTDCSACSLSLTVPFCRQSWVAFDTQLMLAGGGAAVVSLLLILLLLLPLLPPPSIPPLHFLAGALVATCSVRVLRVSVTCGA